MPVIYLSQSQTPSCLMSLIVSTQGPATGVANAVQSEIRTVDGDLGVYDLKTMDAILSNIVALPRLNALPVWLFAALALALSAIGVHGRHVAPRRAADARVRDPGSRLGRARRRSSARWRSRPRVSGATGVLVGLVGALLLARTMASVLYEVAATDAMVLAGASGAVLAVSLAASCRPARTAMRVDSMRVLRAE